MGYQFSIEYKAGTENLAADTLSRRHKNHSLQVHVAVFVGRYDFLDDLRKENLECADLKMLHKQLLDGALDSDLAVTCYPLPKLSHASRPLLMPIAILAGRISHIQGKPQKQVLVQWSHSSLKDATWEELHAFSQLYNVSDLEDKVVFKGDGMPIKDKSYVNSLNIILKSQSFPLWLLLAQMVKLLLNVVLKRMEQGSPIDHSHPCGMLNMSFCSLVAMHATVMGVRRWDLLGLAAMRIVTLISIQSALPFGDERKKTLKKKFKIKYIPAAITSGFSDWMVNKEVVEIIT
ncbi:hypothetical protein FEM48_ZijujUnG0052400 [Ziziphus jujuba var. spinosa]|uniref:Reverse transcriptase RNase H-like domain-containing protein n=1 Tax=Ziziphus jujuba var. spinosa TaxID=714518 RepID=A0A978U962_ZIZJJ|nr:hypothetical protein FEM48_ZijujUnG0052400 [Ziziphus jujuba var. spinosa]